MVVVELANGAPQGLLRKVRSPCQQWQSHKMWKHRAPEQKRYPKGMKRAGVVQLERGLG
ncbi:Uncharacterised protein [uncultured archaeon]|nr:Uncharacterised protein [uncultured archaeon]